jgi:hypothetical protein
MQILTTKRKKCIISNADIYFENLNVCTHINMDKVILSLSRYSFDAEKINYYLPVNGIDCFPALPIVLSSSIRHLSAYLKSYHPKYNNIRPLLNYSEDIKTNYVCNGYTSDAWIFKTPIELSNSFKTIYIGKFRSDNKLTKLFIDKVKNDGYVFENPCLTIKAIHYDFTKEREYWNPDTWGDKTFEGVEHERLFVNWSHISDNFILC